MAVLPSPISNHKFFAADGVTPAAGYEVHTYSAGTTTPLATYSDAAGVSANTNPIILNASGEASIYVTDGLAYDLVLKEPGGAVAVGPVQRVVTNPATAFNDPLAAGAVYLKTLSDLKQGEPVSVFRAISPANYTNIRNGAYTSDLSSAFNSLLSEMSSVGYGHLIVPAGTYYAKEILVPSGTKITGEFKKSVIKAPSGLGITEAIMRNSNQSVGNNDITISDIAFDGNNAGASTTVLRPRNTELVSFGKVTVLRVSDVIVRNVQYIGLAIGGCNDVVLDRVIGHDCGWDSTGPMGSSAEGGAAVWVGPSGGVQSKEVVASNCTLRNNRWAGMYMSANSAIVDGCRFYDNKEAQIFGGRLLPTVDGGNVVISNNRMRGVTKAHISSSSIEVGYWNAVISGNIIEDCQHNCISLTDTQNIRVIGNVLMDFGKELAANGCGVTVFSLATAGNQAKNIRISENRIIDRQGTPTGYAGISIVGAGAASENVHIENNDCSGWTQRSAKMVDIASAQFGTGTFSRNNIGAGDEGKAATIYLQTTNQSVPNATATAISFNTAHVNVETAWVIGSPTRITVPKGWKRVRIHGQVTFAANATGVRRLQVYKNGSAGGYIGGSAMTSPGTAAYSCPLQVSTGVVDVIGGTDYFEIYALHESGGSLDAVAGLANTWFSIEEVE